MEKLLNPKKILESIAEDIYNNLINIPKSPKKVILYGASQRDLVKIKRLIMNHFKERQFNIQFGTLDKLNEDYFVNVKTKYLEKLAFLCKEDFYKLPEEKRRTCILVEGGDEVQREIFRRSLSTFVDVFVYDRQHYPEINGEYLINLDDYF